MCLVGLVCCQVEIAKKLEDGLLVLGGSELRALVAEWTVLVNIDAPPVPAGITVELDEITKAITSDYLRRTFENSTLHFWQQNVQRLRARVMSSSTKGHRQKRAVLGFLGPLFNDLFGLETEQDIQRYVKVVEDTRSEQSNIVHKVNELITVVNHTFKFVQENRVKVNELATYTRKVNSELNYVVKENVKMKLWINNSVIAGQIEIVLNNLELIIYEYQRDVDRYHRQCASLELGRVTEELLPPEKLRDLLQRAMTLGVQPVEPLGWYYRNVVVIPVWSHADQLIYRAIFPLVDNLHYVRYLLKTWKVPYNVSGYSAHLQVMEDVAIDTNRGTIFTPHQCVGNSPEVCRTGPQFNGRNWQCPRGILLGQSALRKHCQIILRKEEPKTYLEEVRVGEYVLATWGKCVPSNSRIL